MRRHPAGCVAIALIVLLLSTRVAAQPAPLPEPAPAPHVRVTEPATITTDSGKSRRVPPGRFMDEPTYSLLDIELRRLQVSETRLTTENASMRKSVSGWRPGWKILASTFVAGALLGTYGTYKATR